MAAGGCVLDLYHRRWQGRALNEDEFVISADEKTQIPIRTRLRRIARNLLIYNHLQRCALRQIAETATRSTKRGLSGPPGDRMARLLPRQQIRRPRCLRGWLMTCQVFPAKAPDHHPAWRITCSAAGFADLGLPQRRLRPKKGAS